MKKQQNISVKELLSIITMPCRTPGASVQSTDYYPFGMPFYSSSGQDVQPYKFGGKELQSEHGLNLLDYVARQYDYETGRFNQFDPLAEKYYSISPYVYCMNNPLKFIDPTGEGVHIIFYTTEDERYKSAAETRQRQLERLAFFDPQKDHVYMVPFDDLGKLSGMVDGIVADATKNGYGMTNEVSFYSHAALDGPQGTLLTSGDYNLARETNLRDDQRQMTLEGWGNINWNFDPDNSVAAFYGCKTASPEKNFAKNFMSVTNVQYTVGQESFASASYSTSEFDRSWRGFSSGKDVYFGKNDNGSFSPATGYKRGTSIVTSVRGNAVVIGGYLYRQSSK